MKRFASLFVAVLFVLSAYAQALTVAEAIAIGQQLEHATISSESYTFEGYVTVITENSFNTNWNNMTFWVADTRGSAHTTPDGALQCYRCRPDRELQVGDKVRVEAPLKRWFETIETGQMNAPVTWLESEDPDPIDPDPVDPDPIGDEVDFNTVMANGGWNALIGQTVTFTNDFVYCDTWNNTIAPRRLLDPEEYGDEGSTAYYDAVAANTRDSCHLEGYTINWRTYRTGSIVRGLRAYIPYANCLQAVNTPQMINHELPTERPDLGDANIVVCASNVENFYVDYATDPEALLVQKQKISAALHHMNADIYALCEVEQGTNASQMICDLLSELDGGSNLYGFVNGGSTSYNSGAVTFIYRKAVVEPYGSYYFPYYSYNMKWREGIQCFKHKATNEKFNISMNHFWAKISKTDADREDNMTKLITALGNFPAYDPDFLVVGDLNAYTMENSNQMLINQKGYIDLTAKYAPGGYSHLYGCYAGYLDHAYCSPSMESQVTMALPYHLNADTPKSIYGYAQGDVSMYRYSDHDPILVGLKIGNTTPEGVEQVDGENVVTKILRDGQLIIIRGGVEYTITGQPIR